MVKNAKKRSARVDYRADISVTYGPIDKRQTRMCREMHGLAYAVSLDERVRGTCSADGTFSENLWFLGVFHDSSWYSEANRL